MKIYVCVKRVPDSAAKITILGKNRIDESVTFLLNPYDENAIEEAVRVRDQSDKSEVIAVCVAPKDAVDTLQSALAMGADRAVLVKTGKRIDSILAASILKTAILDDGNPDIIFTGKESIDAEGMQTMFRLAAMMQMPAASNVVSLSLKNNRVEATCELEAGVQQVLDMPLPCVIGAGKGLNKPRYPTFMDIRNARKKTVKQIDLESFGVTAPRAGMEIMTLKPAVETRRSKALSSNPEAAVDQLIRVLTDDAKVI